MHDVVSGPRGAADGHFNSGLLSTGETFTVKFDEAGSYQYHCTPHGTMNAVIVVQGEPCPNSPPTPPLLASSPPPPPPPQPPASPTVTLPPAQCTVVGAGPGGVLAADVMAGADGCGGSLRLFERGDLPLEGTYDTLPFFETFNKQEMYIVGTYNGAELPFAGVFGGQQTTNGGVFAPGTAAELAAGLAIGTAAAQAAQACAAASVNATYWKPLLGAVPPPVQHIEGQTLLDHNGMLATCVNETGCAWGDMLMPPGFHTPGSAASIRRRTVAHGVHGSGAPDYATLGAEVRSIDFEEDPDSGELMAAAVRLSDGTVSPVADGGKVLLAASSIGSASILARSRPDLYSSFTFNNHYYTASFLLPSSVCVPAGDGEVCGEGPPASTHSHNWNYGFVTPGNGDCAGQSFEVDLRGNYPVPDAPYQVILLQMEPEMRSHGGWNASTGLIDLVDEPPTECDLLARRQAINITSASWGAFTPGFSLDSSHAAVAAWPQGWHWAGGIPLVDGSSRVAGTTNVFSADAGAVRKPFNCHTSMVSAAAGVIAGMEALGLPTADCMDHITASFPPPPPPPVSSEQMVACIMSCDDATLSAYRSCNMACHGMYSPSPPPPPPPPSASPSPPPPSSSGSPTCEAAPHDPASNLALGDSLMLATFASGGTTFVVRCDI